MHMPVLTQVTLDRHTHKAYHGVQLAARNSIHEFAVDARVFEIRNQGKRQVFELVLIGKSPGGYVGHVLLKPCNSWPQLRRYVDA